jgi:transcriptional regulator with XRE-family HTH domain
VSVVSYSLLDELMAENDKAFYKQLGERVSTFRKERHLTQVELAKILGISQQMMAALELGARKIPVSMLPTLSKIFEISIAELLGEKEIPNKRGPSSVLYRQIEQIRKLPRVKQKFIIEMLNAVIKQQSL